MSSMLFHPEVHSDHDFLPITGTDYLELYVGNARQSAYYYRAAFGMSLVAWAGPETGLRDRASYVVEQGGIRLVLTTPLRPDCGIADHIRRHGDGVRDIAFCVDDAKLAWREATRRGARSVHECHELEDDFGRVKLASIAAYGDTIHTFVERGKYFGPFLPGYEVVDHNPSFCDPVARPVGLTAIDHIAGNVGWNELRRWIDFYTGVLGFSLHPSCEDDDDSAANASGASKVVTCNDAGINFPINEPAELKRGAFERSKPTQGKSTQGKSWIEEYLESYHGPGVQRIALATEDILETVDRMRSQGVEFLKIPSSYYMTLRTRRGEEACVEEPIAELERLGILVDRDDSGYMLQAVTRPVEDRPTLFFEIVQRKGCGSFGAESLRSLAEAMETGTKAVRS
jgi:4-hydroxyphenylpyruvate dioxygenase